MKQADILLLLLQGILAPTAHALNVSAFSCTTTQSYEADCKVHFSGVAQADDVLHISGISDIDKTFFNGDQIGETGYFNGIEFKAHFIPRLYPLSPLIGTPSPTVTLRIKSVDGVSLGLSKESIVEVVSSPDAFRIRLKFLAYLCTCLAVFGGFLTLGFRGFNPLISDGWQWSSCSQRLFWFSASGFIASMTEIPRVVVPHLILGPTYVLLHGVVEAISLYGLAELIRETNFLHYMGEDAKQPPRWQEIQKMLSRLGFLSACSILVYFYGQKNIQQAHANAVLLQTGAVFIVASLQLSKLALRRTIGRSLTSSAIFVFTQYVTVGALLRDAIVYKFFHDSSRVYSLPYFYMWVLLAGVGRLSEIRWRERRGTKASARTSTVAGGIQEAKGKIDSITRSLAKDTGKWSERVTLTSIRDNNYFIESSVGREARYADESAEPIEELILRLIEEDRAHYLDGFAVVSPESHPLGLCQSCIALPIHEGGSLVAVLAIVTRKNTRIPPGTLYELRLRSQSLKNDIGNAIHLLAATHDGSSSIQHAALEGITSQVVHDLKSPLALLASVTSSSADLPKDARELLQMGTLRISEIAKKLQGSLRRPAIVACVSTLTKELIREKHVELSARLPNIRLIEGSIDVPAFAVLDRDDFQCVLSNLINNGAEAIEGSGEVRVSVSRAASGTQLSIVDTGKGLSDTALRVLGKRRISVGKVDGTGHGLYHAKQCIERWGGRLHLTSNEKSGTTVTLFFPAV
jgi:signal transduction histidine kinase